MPKLNKDLYGVKNGDVYPTTIEKGQDCPAELLEAALETKAVDEKEGLAALEKYRKRLADEAAAAAAAAAEADDE